MATFRHALVLAALLGTGPALAQSQDPAGARAGRRLTTTGQTKPPGPAADPVEPVRAERPSRSARPR